MNYNCNNTCTGNSCGYKFIVPEGRFPKETPNAMSYVPFQEWEKTYPENKALEIGTIFPSLNLPYVQGGAKQDWR